MSSSVFLLLMAIIPIAHSGVLLTYPQARFPPLDYLPDDLTMPPCGVPKPTKPFYTTFHIGSEYNVSWITPASTNVFIEYGWKRNSHKPKCNLGLGKAVVERESMLDCLETITHENNILSDDVSESDVP
ncbi:hypothetical protein CRE_20779 [Caenorhabditis remanei]|uniref:Uncharacterized protein n=1 Tax=Caenorhabditis remanei TaxID=31234 RepID=E3MFI5_CAERE|nr:hypothetical protein CRE_20779 [Caenorhabditis remanei]